MLAETLARAESGGVPTKPATEEEHQVVTNAQQALEVLGEIGPIGLKAPLDRTVTLKLYGIADPDKFFETINAHPQLSDVGKAAMKKLYPEKVMYYPGFREA